MDREKRELATEERFRTRINNNQVEAIVMSTEAEHLGPLRFVSCSAADKLTGKMIEHLPCAGMDIRPGDQILVSVSRLVD